MSTRARDPLGMKADTILTLIGLGLSLVSTVATIIGAVWYLSGSIKENSVQIKSLRNRVQRHGEYLHEHLIDLGSRNKLPGCQICDDHSEKGGEHEQS